MRRDLENTGGEGGPWTKTDAQVRKAWDKQDDTLVVHAVNDVVDLEVVPLRRAASGANALSRPPGEYGRKVKNSNELTGAHKRWSMWFNSMQREEPYLVLTSTKLSRDGLVPSGTVRQVLHGCRQLVL